ncbi:MAG: type II toxin-antitoxin system VapB family antitoxin [Chloroflexi bacterium]|nr:type II toxin-antitoxin system VapB family antitoxin [Chloroflexota bacterium]
MDIDDRACAEVMRRYRLATEREAINFALRTLAVEPLCLDEARALRGSDWDGDLDAMRTLRHFREGGSLEQVGGNSTNTCASTGEET